MAIFILSLAVFSYASLAAYVGLAAFLAMHLRVPGHGVFVFTAFVILIPLGCFLFDPDFYQWLDALTFRDAGPSRGFFTGYFLLNAAFFAGMALSYFSARKVPAPVYHVVRRISAYAASPSIVWVIINSRGLFLPFTMIPDSNFLTIRVIFIACFALVSFGTFCLLAAASDDNLIQ